MDYADDYDYVGTGENTVDPKDHMVQCTINVSANDYDKIKSSLSHLEGGDKYFDELETKRELAIMHEVRKQPGFSILDQVDNTIWEWEHEKQVTRRGDNNRYKLKYKY